MKRKFADLVATEVNKVRITHKPINSHHEGLGLLLEEVNEVQNEVFKKTKNRDSEETLKELVQVAGICQRMAEDLNLL